MLLPIQDFIIIRLVVLFALSIHATDLVGSEGDSDLDDSVQRLSTAEKGGDAVVFTSTYFLPGICGIMIPTPSI